MMPTLSVLALPSRLTGTPSGTPSGIPSATVRSGPAWAVGGVESMTSNMVSVPLLPASSETFRITRYIPATGKV